MFKVFTCLAALLSVSEAFSPIRNPVSTTSLNLFPKKSKPAAPAPPAPAPAKKGLFSAPAKKAAPAPAKKVAAAPAPVKRASASSTSSFASALGAQPPLGFWDPLGLLKDADQERFDRLRTVELKHGRISMLAVLGHLTTTAGVHLPGDIAFGVPFSSVIYTLNKFPILTNSKTFFKINIIC